MTTMHPADKTYRNQVVRLAELTVLSDVIDGVTFENCEIIGPAVIVMLHDCYISGFSVDGDVDAVIWRLGAREKVIGAVGFANCNIIECRLRRIGLGVPDSQLDMVMAALVTD